MVFRILGWVLVSSLWWASVDVKAQSSGGIYIDVGSANVKKSLVALPPFQFQGSPAAAKNAFKTGKEIYDTVFNDLSVSNYFEFIDQAAFLEDTSKVGLKPAPGEAGGFKYDAWKQIGTEFLIRVGYRTVGNDLTVEAFLYHVPQTKQLLARSYKAAVKDARVLAHTLCNDIIKELTGKRGIFLTKIVASRSTQGNHKEIFIMDWDGANAKAITNHRTISQSPAWSPDGKSIAYTSFTLHANDKSRNADLYIYEILTGKRWLVSYRKGINSGANFMPGSQHLLFTSSAAGNPDIYKMSIEGKLQGRLTDGPRGAMNVEPAISPDGTKIAFSSDRSAQPMIYVMNVDGSNVKRVTIAGQYNSTPAWSPDGKRLAFSGFDKSNFDIFLMDADGMNMSRLTSARKTNGKAANNENPSFSPDGRHILFSSDRTGNPQLFLVNVDGSNERRLTFDRHNYFKPQWSPYLD